MEIVFIVAGVTTAVTFGLCFANRQIRSCIDAQNSTLRNKFEPMQGRRSRSEDTTLLLPIRSGSRH
jgi:hypothetical protein